MQLGPNNRMLQLKQKHQFLLECLITLSFYSITMCRLKRQLRLLSRQRNLLNIWHIYIVIILWLICLTLSKRSEQGTHFPIKPWRLRLMTGSIIFYSTPIRYSVNMTSRIPFLLTHNGLIKTAIN